MVSQEEDRSRATTGLDDAGAGQSGGERSREIQQGIDAMRAQAPDGKFTEHAGGGGAAGSGGTGGPAADPSDKGAYGGGGT